MPKLAKLSFHYPKDIIRNLSVTPECLAAISKKKEDFYKIEPEEIKGKVRRMYKCRGHLRTFLRRLHLSLSRLDALPEEMLGGVRGRSIFHNAKRHSGKKYVLNLDLKDFFLQIRPRQIKAIFKKLGCNDGMSNLLTYLTTADNHIPQGFATSPILSAFVLLPFTEELRTLLRRQNLVFTFWIDDLTISGSKNPEGLLPEIRSLCKKYGLELNEKKRRLGVRGKKSQSVTGVAMSGGSMSVGAPFIRETEKIIHCLTKFGWESLSQELKLESKNKTQLLAKLKGRLLHIGQLNDTKAKKLSLILQEAASPT